MPVTYINRAARNTFDRRWFSKPEFYVPLVGVLVLLVGGIVYALYLSAVLSAEASSFGKQKIMELYLNRIYFGGGLYGAEAASRGYFGKPAREISLAEAATLAGLIKSPNRLSPWSDKAAARDARNVVLARMRDLSFISAEHCVAAQNEEIAVGDRQSAQGQTYAVDY